MQCCTESLNEHEHSVRDYNCKEVRIVLQDLRYTKLLKNYDPLAHGERFLLNLDSSECVSVASDDASDINDHNSTPIAECVSVASDDASDINDHNSTPIAECVSVASDDASDINDHNSTPIAECVSVASDDASDINDHNSTPIAKSTQTDHQIAVVMDSPPRTIPTYHIVERGTRKGKNLLVDSDGYSYNVRKAGTKITNWWCTVRNRHERCGAWVIQRGNEFTAGFLDHLHAPKPSTLARSRCAVKVKEQARTNVFASAMSIVEDVLNDESMEGSITPLDLEGLSRCVHRVRAKFRPQDPVDLDFVIDYDFVGSDFVKKDVLLDGNRHVIMATDIQIRFLEDSTSWFIGGTVRVVRKPFCQLFSIHAFFENDGMVKQTPLVFVLMSSQTKNDYIAVFQAVNDLMVKTSVCEFVADFETSLWQALKEVYPQVTLSVCNFHLTQAILMKVKSLDLLAKYRTDEFVFNFIRKLMALPFLPADHIMAAFDNLTKKSTTPELQTLCEYIKETWLTSSLWPLSSISTYRKLIRSINDVEGYHRRLNVRARNSGLAFYALVALLLKESKLIDLNRKLMTARKMKNHQKKSKIHFHKQIWALWDAYQNDELTPRQLIREVARCHGSSLTTL